jgi:hypothetical protein
MEKTTKFTRITAPPPPLTASRPRCPFEPRRAMPAPIAATSADNQGTGTSDQALNRLRSSLQVAS